jgi:hypothetical protein
MHVRHDEVVSVRFDRTELERIREVARITGRSRGQLIRIAVRVWLAAHASH